MPQAGPAIAPTEAGPSKAPAISRSCLCNHTVTKEKALGSVYVVACCTCHRHMAVSLDGQVWRFLPGSIALARLETK